MTEARLRTLVCHYLDSYLLENATFLCERLVAAHPGDDNLFLLATCHARQGLSGKRRAHGLLQGAQSEQCRYLLAHCALEIDKLQEAEAVLLETTNVNKLGLEGELTSVSRLYMPLLVSCC
jgi:Anaphase-promoting complex, cyclosome, subunit 3